MARHHHDFREVIACLFDDPTVELYRAVLRERPAAAPDYS
jgi:hypothetical protein